MSFISSHSGTAFGSSAPPQSTFSSLFGFFGQRSFRRLIAILGLGSAVAIAYTALRDHVFDRIPYFGSGTLEVTAEIDAPEEKEEVRVEEVTVKPDEEEVVATADAETDVPEEEPATKKDIITLYQVPRGFFAPSVSPFGLKLETFLRVARIEHNIEMNDSMALPYIKIGDEEIRDYTMCVKRLCEKFNIDLSSEATSSRKTAARLVDALLEGKISWGISLWRWVYDGGRSLKDIQPLAPTSPEVMANIREEVSKAAYYQGMGRKTEEEVTEMIFQALTDLTAALGKHHYFLGSKPGEVDCAAFGILAQMVWNMPGSEFEKAIKQHKPLMEFVIRMRENYWPDWATLIQQTNKNDSQAASMSKSVRQTSQSEQKHHSERGEVDNHAHDKNPAASSVEQSTASRQSPELIHYAPSPPPLNTDSEIKKLKPEVIGTSSQPQSQNSNYYQRPVSAPKESQPQYDFGIISAAAAFAMDAPHRLSSNQDSGRNHITSRTPDLPQIDLHREFESRGFAVDTHRPQSAKPQVTTRQIHHDFQNIVKSRPHSANQNHVLPIPPRVSNFTPIDFQEEFRKSINATKAMELVTPMSNSMSSMQQQHDQFTSYRMPMPPPDNASQAFYPETTRQPHYNNRPQHYNNGTGRNDYSRPTTPSNAPGFARNTLNDANYYEEWQRATEAAMQSWNATPRPVQDRQRFESYWK